MPADQAGFAGFHLAEHHGSDLCMAPNQEVFIAAASQVTTQETDYLPMYDSFCMTVCAHGGSGCAAGDLCHPVQLWGFSGRDVNEVVGVCAPPPPGGPPRT